MNPIQRKIRAAVVGAGYLGKFHAQKYANMENVDLIGVADTDMAAAERVAASLDTRAYADYTDLFGRVDAVSVVVPTSAHFEVSKDFLLHNVDLLVEKPFTTTLQEADELIRISESRGLLVQVGHLERYNPAVVALQDIIKNPLFIESHRLGIFKPRATDVSVVLDLMIHDIDIILNFVKAEMEGIRAAGMPVITENVDIANARLEFKSGCVANVTASRVSMKDERKLRIFQRDAYISIDFANHEATIVHKNAGKTDGLIPGMEIETRSFPKGDALDDELKSFVNSVRSRTEPYVTGQMGRDALKTALDVMSQIRQTRSKLAFL
ncbi:MAG: Gfo/Idh/MocA family oxidoreductase [Deltaproteobacteria bacterium]|jgi:predicted dehydrogenase|nr:Gfo/Idh/MocA family oxidoreductase [Deltaproteobacteria bacterium]